MTNELCYCSSLSTGKCDFCTGTRKVYRNTKWTGRDYECTNVVAAISTSAPTANYVECDLSFIANMQQLWIEGNAAYWGWM